MTKTHIQLAGLVSLAILAAGLLLLIGYTFANAIGKATPDGKVPLADAGLFTAFLLSFQQTVGAIRSIWESQERTALAEGLSNSVPTGAPNPPATKEPRP
ncbi:MAG TPA: hypothetical protein VF695_06275 [Sphingomonas sp.]|jgi:hypothetical protein